MVIDSSALIDALAHDDGASVRTLLAGQQLHAPELIGVEYLNWMRRADLLGQLAPGLSNELLRQYQALPLTRYPMHWLADRIWELRHTITPYDATYVALAEALDAPLVTRDRRLAEAAAPWVSVIAPE